MSIVAYALAAVTTPHDPAFTEQAKRCGIAPEDIVWSIDSEGKAVPSISPPADLHNLSFEAVKCLVGWAQRNGRTLGFISEPPPKR